MFVSVFDHLVVLHFLFKEQIRILIDCSFVYSILSIRFYISIYFVFKNKLHTHFTHRKRCVQHILPKFSLETIGGRAVLPSHTAYRTVPSRLTSFFPIPSRLETRRYGINTAYRQSLIPIETQTEITLVICFVLSLMHVFVLLCLITR
jgi:hypothetical protein